MLSRIWSQCDNDIRILQNGTECCNEALQKLGKDYDIVVNIQGDEPLIELDIIDGIVRALQQSFMLLFPELGLPEKLLSEMIERQTQAGTISCHYQVDWEVILSSTPNAFMNSIKPWLYPSLRFTTAWKHYPV